MSKFGRGTTFFSVELNSTAYQSAKKQSRLKPTFWADALFFITSCYAVELYSMVGAAFQMPVYDALRHKPIDTRPNVCYSLPTVR